MIGAQVIAALCILAQTHQPLLPVDLSEGWTHRTDGAWRMRYDRRALLAMRHPWEASNQGDFASASRDVTVPEGWTGGVHLSFYCSDDYHTDAWRPDGSWLTAEGFIGHRVKRVLVDDHVAWNADVSDPVVKGESPRCDVELPVKAGQTFLLTLLVFDAVSSRTFLEQDFYQSANDEKKRDEDPDAARFQTHVYWGDISLHTGEATVRPGKRPSEKMVRARHVQRWPLPPFGDEWKDPVTLEVSAPAGVPEAGFPIRCGVPIPFGKAEDVMGIALRTGKKAAISTRKTALSHWRDKSVKWVSFDFPVGPDLEQVEMSFSSDAAKAPAQVKIKEGDNETEIDAGAIRFEAIPTQGVANIRLSGKTKVESVSLALGADDEDVPAATDWCAVIDEGPFASTTMFQGRFDTLDRTMGSFRLFCSAYAGLPYVKLVLKLFNDTAADLAVSSLVVRFTLSDTPSDLRVPDGEAENGFVMTQTSETSRDLNGKPVDASLPAFAAWKGGAVTVRNFRELFPKRASIVGKDVILDLVAAGNTPIVFTPGEAKSHEVWLAFGDVDPAQLAKTVARPPVLQNAAYFCATGAFGPAATHENVPVLRGYMAGSFGDKRWEDFGQRFGVRDFPDSPYYGGLPKWSNNYYERMLGLWSEWLMGGGRAWHGLASDVCRHLMDVAIVHSEVPGKHWVGAMHGPGENHVAAPWNPCLRAGGFAMYYRLTGDTEARDAFLGVADYCLRTRAGIGGDVRNQAGPFDAICSAYDETGEMQFLDDGAARVESVLAAVDARRGVWPDEHGSRVYRGNIPWMVAQIARPLYLWYHATGDVQAAQALVGLAESVVCENTDWDEPGVVSGYSHNPHFDVSAGYDLIILPMIFAAYELTDDTFFLDAAKAQWARSLREKAFDSPLNCYWCTPWLMWYLEKYGIVGGEPSP